MSEEGSCGGRPVRVFISYAHESAAHTEAVRELWVLLRANGVDARLDRVAAQRRQDWSLWMMEQVREADCVLVVASQAYKRRAEGRAAAEEGRGVQFEASLIRNAFYRDQRALERFVPVVLPGQSVDDVPDFLTPATTTVYHVVEFTLAGAEALLRLLTAQPAEVEPVLGPVPVLGQRDHSPGKGSVLRHDVVLDVGLSGGLLRTQTMLAGTVLGEWSAALPREVPSCWDGLAGSAVAAEGRLAAVGHALRRALWSEVTTRHLVELCDHSPLGTVIDIVVRLEDEIAGLPVELLRWPDGRVAATTPGVRFTRRLAGVSERAATPPSAGPLKILAAVAAPEETATENAPLDVEAEMQAILDAITELDTEGQAQVRILEVASLDQISAALTRDQYHVLHLSAHGSPTSVELENEDGQPVVVGAAELVGALRAGKHPLPVVVLSSCAGGAGGVEGLAATLVRCGADRVVAMHTSVTDDYATALARGFYQALSREVSCSVAEALADARQRVEQQQRTAACASGIIPRPEYGVPTLLAAGADPPLREVGEPVPLHRPTQPPRGVGVRELPIGDLIGRRAQLRVTMAALRGSRADREKVGAWSGVVLTGVGGIGKTAVAGRALSRLRAEGWLTAEHIGVWSPLTLIDAVANALEGTEYTPAQQLLGRDDVEDTHKLSMIMRLLHQQRLLVLFDDFEQNLSVGSQFLDPGFAEIFQALLAAAQTGRVLVTCRYPLPEADCLLRVEMPALSPSELRRLFLRLPALRELETQDRRLITRTIGGHPRLIEFVDVLLRQGGANFVHITQKLRRLARAENLDITSPRTVEQGVAQAVLLGSRDIVLEELVAGLSPTGRELLLQAAISSAPFTRDDLTVARYGPDPSTEQRQLVAADAERLRDLTLLSSTHERQLLVHPWVADALRRHQGGEEERARRHRQAVVMRVQRVTEGRGGFDDLVEIIRHYAGCRDYDHAVAAAFQACDLVGGTVAVAALLAEAVPLIPPEHPQFLALADRECEMLLQMGIVGATIERRHAMHNVAANRAAADPGNAQAQRDLSVSHNNLGDLAMAVGDSAGAQEHYQAGLEIDQRLAAADPGNAQAQRDLSVSHNNLGDLAMRAGDSADTGTKLPASADPTLAL
ncbi:MAG: CHAT domain-containing protein [Pseudonocardiales bacterium]|nr:CHAT domain-containing protein [Pseudonocardiales bacterium]